jgi:hypothetical protein
MNNVFRSGRNVKAIGWKAWRRTIPYASGTMAKNYPGGDGDVRDSVHQSHKHIPGLAFHEPGAAHELFTGGRNCGGIFLGLFAIAGPGRISGKSLEYQAVR